MGLIRAARARKGSACVGPKDWSASGVEQMGESQRENEREIKRLLLDIFQKLDTNHDQTIDEEEAMAMSILMGETQAEAEESWREMLRDMDLNHDGFIQEQEWIDYQMKTLTLAPPAKAIAILKQTIQTFENHQTSNPGK